MNQVNTQKNWMEYLRLITPILIFILGVYVNQVDRNIEAAKKESHDSVVRIEATLNDINEKMFKHLTNDEIHTPKTIVMSKAEFSVYDQMRGQQITDIRQSIVELKTMQRDNTNEIKAVIQELRGEVLAKKK